MSIDHNAAELTMKDVLMDSKQGFKLFNLKIKCQTAHWNKIDHNASRVGCPRSADARQADSIYS